MFELSAENAATAIRNVIFHSALLMQTVMKRLKLKLIYACVWCASARLIAHSIP